jgi:outer membrane protein TolC
MVAIALARRPDLRSTRHAIEQAGERAGLATAELFTLTGIADANNSGRAFEIGPGVDLRIPIFHQNQGARARAAAEIEPAVRRHRTVRDRVGLAGREAHARVTAARHVAAAQADMQALLVVAEQQAAAAHRAGDQPILARHLAALQRLDGLQRAAEAAAELQRAEAQLARSLGGTPP